MQTRSVRLPRSKYLERGGIDLSQKARQRLRWLDYYLNEKGGYDLPRLPYARIGQGLIGPIRSKTLT